MGRFLDVPPANDPFSGVPGVFRSLACGGVNGAVDLLVTSIAGPARLLRAEAREQVRQALQLNPTDARAKQLQEKLEHK